MNKVLLLSIGILFLSVGDSFSQNDTLNIQGRIINKTDNTPLPGATVMMINIKDSTRSKYTSTDVNGVFKVDKLEKAFYKLRVSSIAYKPFQKLIRLQLKTNDMGDIFLEENVVQIGDVIVQGQRAPVQQRGDTTQYNADAFKTNVDATSSDLVKKMPGIEVTSSGVTANGENIQQVLLDGKRFFGQDPLLSLNTIPAEVVDKVLVYDEQSERSKLTGFDDGNTTKTMDLITKSGKQNGQFGKVYGCLLYTSPSPRDS